MSKLLKCPFCGGEARVRDCTREEQTTIVNGEMYKMCGCEHYCAEMFGYTEEEAIEKWNTRTPMDNIVEKLEEEKQRLRNFKNDCIALSDSEVIAIEEKAYNFAINIVKQEINNGLE